MLKIGQCKSSIPNIDPEVRAISVSLIEVNQSEEPFNSIVEVFIHEGKTEIYKSNELEIAPGKSIKHNFKVEYFNQQETSIEYRFTIDGKSWWQRSSFSELDFLRVKQTNQQELEFALNLANTSNKYKKLVSEPFQFDKRIVSGIGELQWYFNQGLCLTQYHFALIGETGEIIEFKIVEDCKFDVTLYIIRGEYKTRGINLIKSLLIIFSTNL